MQISNNINTINSYTADLNTNAEKLVNVANDEASKQVDLGRILTDNISMEHGLDAQIRSIKTQDETLGTLFDIRG